jgi:DNA-binding NarL/FixJ family response regulator
MHEPPNPTNPPARVLVVDDHSIVRHGLALLLARHRDLVVCGEAGTYEEAVARVRELRPDIALIDISLKDRSGLDLIRELLPAHPELKMLVLSMHDEQDYAEKALRAGAQGYVMKEEADAMVVEAIRQVLHGEVFVSPPVSSRLLRHHTQQEPGGAERPQTGIESLTERELQIFRFLGQGLTSRKIAEQLNLSARTVEVHRANIKRKLQCEDAAQLLREAVRWVEVNPA